MEEDLDQLVSLHHVPGVMAPREEVDRNTFVCKRCGAWRKFDHPMLRACLSKLLFGRCPKFSEEKEVGS